MIKLITKILKFNVRGQKPGRLDRDQLQKLREHNYNKYSNIYSSSDRLHVDKAYEEVLYGKTCHIVGITSDSQQSATYIKSAFHYINPDLVIVGGFNSSKVLSSKIAKTVLQKKAVRNLDNVTSPSSLYCKSLLAPMVTKMIQQDQNCVVNQNSQTVYQINHDHKHIQSSNYLTILNKAMFVQYCKLSFGMPSDHIIFQDIMANQDINQLRNAFQRVVSATIVKDQWHQQRRNCRVYYPAQVLEQMRFNALLQPILHKKQLTYTTSLLNKSASLYDRVLLFVQNEFVHQISENVHKISLDPKLVYRGGQTTRNLNQQKQVNNHTQHNVQEIDQLLQKFAILNILKNDSLQHQLMKDDQNVFIKTIFVNKFRAMTLRQIQNKYKVIRQRYHKRISQIIRNRIKNVQNYRQQYKYYYTLSQMIKVQQQRNTDYPIKFEVQNRSSRAELKKDMHELNAQIQSMISKQLTQTQKQLIEDHTNKLMTRQSVVLMQKLIVQAKLRLKKSHIKLPFYHYGGMSSLFKDQISGMMLNKNNKQSHKQKLIQQINKLKKQNIIREATDQELQKITQGQSPTMTIGLDEETGKITLDQNLNTNRQQKYKKMIKNDQIFRQLYNLTEKHKDKQNQNYQQGLNDQQNGIKSSKSTKRSIKFSK